MDHSATHRRHSIRLREFDYSQPGGYSITIVTQNRECMFGEIVDGGMVLNHAGRMVRMAWDELPDHYVGVETDIFMVMPNHIHGIIVLVGAAPCGRPDRIAGHENRGQAQGPAPTLSLPDVVHRFKTLTTKRYTEGVKESGWSPFPGKLWQRNYYEHIIRDENELYDIREYIMNNPLKWEFDDENPHHR